MRLEAALLVPVTEDAQVGNGLLHPPGRWLWLQEQFEVRFGGWTLAPGEHYGLWVDENGVPCVDRSRKYLVDIDPPRRTDPLDLVVEIGGRFRQRAMRVVVRGEVEYVFSGLS